MFDDYVPEHDPVELADGSIYCPRCTYDRALAARIETARIIAEHEARTDLDVRAAANSGPFFTVKGYSPRTIDGRTMTSPLAATYDYDVRGFALSTQAGTLAADPFPVDYARPSGATRIVGLSEHGASLGHHPVSPRWSRKRRSTFTVRGHGKLYAPVTDEESGLCAGSSIDLARLADGILSMADDDDRSWLARIAGANARGYLVGTHGRAFAQVTPSLLLRGSRKAADRYHAGTLVNGTDVGAGMFAVAVHTADLAGYLSVRNLREQLGGSLSRERDRDGRLIRPTDRYTLRGSWRVGEREPWTELVTSTGRRTGQYVKRAAGSDGRGTVQTLVGPVRYGVTICHAWHSDSVKARTVKVDRGTLGAAIRFVYGRAPRAGRITGYRDGRIVRDAAPTGTGRLVLAARLAPERVVTVDRPQPRTVATSHSWHGHRLMARPVKSRSSTSASAGPSAAAVKVKRDPRVNDLAARLDTGTPVTVGSFTVTVRPSGGKHAFTVDRDGKPVATGRLRSLRAVAVRVLAVTD